MASDFDVNLSTIHFVNASPVQQLELFVNGEIDAMACWEPWASQAQYVGGIFYFSGLYSNIPGHEGPVNWLTGQSMLVTFEERISKEPDLLIAFLKAMEKATNYLHATLNKAVSVFSDLLGIERHELAELLQKNMYTMNMDDDFQIGLVSVLNMFASNPEFLNGRNVPELTELYDSHLLIQVNPVLVQLPPINPRQDEIEIITEGNIYYPARVNIRRSGTAPLRYIIIDDTQIVVEIFSTIIDMMEGEVVGTASTGAEAFVLYIDLLPDVVVMDISMPDMNGIEAMKSIFGMNPAANIIVISGNDYEDIRLEVFQLGAKLFIGKPFHIDQIMEVLEKLIIS
jgi:CheY-like chemotaxis protein